MNTAQTPDNFAPNELAQAIRTTRAALDFGADTLSYDISERLRAARVRALDAPSKQTTTTRKAPKKSSWVHSLHHLSGWLKGAIAVSTLAFVMALTTGTTLSDGTSNIASHALENPSLTASKATPINTDEEIDAILQEKIPLQAYLNEDFNQYAQTQAIKVNNTRTLKPNKAYNQ